MLSCKSREQMQNRKNLSRIFEKIGGHFFVQEILFEEQGNYRPVSLLSSSRKVFESVPPRNMLGFSKNCKILSLNHYGVRRKSHVSTQLKISEY